MNLRVDLILESEQRSASLLSLKLLIRIVAALVPLGLLFLVGSQVMEIVVINSEVRGLEAEWKKMGPREKRAWEQAYEYQLNLAVRNELNGWRNSRVNWHEQIVALMQEIPTNVQLQSLSVGHAFQLIDDKVPARLFSIDMKGKAFGTNAESSVRRIERRLTEGPAFSNLTSKVEVPQFVADTARGADKNDRIFAVTCQCKERKLE
jgi:hypothetical protein